MVIEVHLLRGVAFYVFGKIYLEIIVDQNTQGDNFCKISGPHRKNLSNVDVQVYARTTAIGMRLKSAINTLKYAYVS